MAESAESEFPGDTFPNSFVVLYCPIVECEQLTPFVHSEKMLDHLNTVHGIQIHLANYILPFFDRYLDAISKEFEATGKHMFGLPEDAEDGKLRDQLQRETLDKILKTQAVERTHTYKQGRGCLFCVHICDSKLELFDHMFKAHGFNIGQLDNLVFVDEFLDRLQGVLDSYHCIFCGRNYHCKTTLKKHMKNKSHYRIDPKNHAYDKYYVINYAQVGKLWKDFLLHDNEDDDYDDNKGQGKNGIAHAKGLAELERLNRESLEWEGLDDPIDQRTMCLFCTSVFPTPYEELLEHLSSVHAFNLAATFGQLEDEYARIKAINYLRCSVRNNTCPRCEVRSRGPEQLYSHLHEHMHCSLPEPREIWDQPQYLFPIFDDDPLLIMDDWNDNDSSRCTTSGL